MRLEEHIETMADAIHELKLQEQICDDLKQELEFMIQKMNEVLFCVEAIRPGMAERMRIAIEQDVEEEIKGTRRPNMYLNRLIEQIKPDNYLE
jgi:agmatine/peptidylarginine deiminase